MINPQEINIDKLPSVDLADRNNLPNTAGIYFAIDPEGIVQYIGQTKSLKNRILNHNKYCIFEMIGVDIAYLEIKQKIQRLELEAILINQHKPALNKYIPNLSYKEKSTFFKKVKIIKTVYREVPDLGQKIKRLRKTSGKTVEQLANLAGITRQHWYLIEKENFRDGLPYETFKAIEEALDASFGVKFDD